MQVENINIDELKPFEKNPKKHPQEQIDKIVKSVKEFGWANPILALKENKMVIAGHARLKAARQMNLSEVPVIFLDMPYEKAIAYVVADNRLAEIAEWDNTMLLPLLEEIKLSGVDVELTGFTAADILIMNKKEVEEDNFDAQAAADAIKYPVTKLGDIWILGKHKLCCGDSTKKEDVKRIVTGYKIELIWADPPYGISAVDKNSRMKELGWTQYINDDTITTAIDIFKICLEYKTKMIFWGANHYAKQLPNSPGWVVWDKQDGKDSLTYSQCELAWTNVNHNVQMFTHIWDGFRRDSEKGDSRVHPSQKPIALVGWFIQKFGNKFTNIFDPCGGSGITIIACEQLDRICYMMELDPIYCDVIVQRWEKFTGQKAHLQEVTP